MAITTPGYNGKILRVNLSNKSTKTEEIDEQFCRRYLGGAGFIVYYLWKELKAGIDPLSPDNRLIFALGPVSGILLPGAARNCIGAKSPLTGGIAKAEVGGHWMAELKRAGYDAIIIEGKSAEPVYLWVHDGEASILDAGHLWGKKTHDTETAIRTELGDNHIQVALIGPAGENQVRFACIMEGCFSAAARGGLGAVMGSKNLKAVAVRGHKLPPVVNSDKVREIRQQLIQPHPLSAFGTGGPEMLHREATGDLPIRNFRDGGFPEVKNIHAKVIKDTLGLTMDGCFACPIRCKKVVSFEEPYRVEAAYGGPHYETLAAFGSDCGVSDLKAIIKGNEMCNALSLDSISTGSTIAFAIECFEKGLLTIKDTGGLVLKWGDADGMLNLIDLIARREGIGNLLAEGTLRMSGKIGKGSAELAMHVKGLEAAMHEPRQDSFLFLASMLSATGADHSAVAPEDLLYIDKFFQTFHSLGWTTPPVRGKMDGRKVGIFRDLLFMHIIYDSLVVCSFPGMSIDQTVELLKGITGWDTGMSEIMRIAERIVTLMRLFNIREGFTDADDKMPERFYHPTQGGPLADVKIDRETYEKARKYYYVLMGWDARGVPLPEKVEELSIE